MNCMHIENPSTYGFKNDKLLTRSKSEAILHPRLQQLHQKLNPGPIYKSGSSSNRPTLTYSSQISYSQQLQKNVLKLIHPHLAQYSLDSDNLVHIL